MKKTILIVLGLLILAGGGMAFYYYNDTTKALAKSEVAVQKCDADLKKYEAKTQDLSPKDANSLPYYEKELSEIDRILFAENMVYAISYSRSIWISEQRKKALEDQLKDITSRWNHAKDKLQAVQKAVK